MIISFLCKETEKIFLRVYSKRFSTSLQSMMRRKLLMLDHAHCLEDLKSPPGNRLEKLVGNRKGQHSIRINNQWRICFKWRDHDNNVEEVEVVDYH